MRWIWLFLLILNNCFAYCQINSAIQKLVVDKPDTVKTGSVEILNEKLLTIYADSIDNYKLGKLPEFLFNQCLDNDGRFFRTFHSQVSTRWYILQRVTNKSALKKILNMQKKEMKRKCDVSHDEKFAYLEIPLINQSFYQLFLRRYKQLSYRK